MSLQAMIWAFRTEVRNVGAKFVLLALAEHAREDANSCWVCFPSVNRLAKFTAQSERTVERHLVWLVQNGWLRREKRNRSDGWGAYVYTLLPENVTGGARAQTRQIDGVEPTESTATPERMTSAYKEPVRKPVSKPKPQNEDEFEAWWAEYPRKVEKLGARAAYRRIVDAGTGSAAELMAGARRYAVEVRGRDLRLIKHPTRWLNLGCWADSVSRPRLRLVEAGPESAPAFGGPQQLWSAAVALKGEPWAMSWLAPCHWDAEGRVLLARTAFAATRIGEELRSMLRSLGVQLSVASTDARAAPNDLCASKGVVSTPSFLSGPRA